MTRSVKTFNHRSSQLYVHFRHLPLISFLFWMALHPLVFQNNIISHQIHNFRLRYCHIEFIDSCEMIFSCVSSKVNKLVIGTWSSKSFRKKLANLYLHFFLFLRQMGFAVWISILTLLRSCSVHAFQNGYTKQSSTWSRLRQSWLR